MASIVIESFKDAQTSITSLSAAVAGALSEKAGNLIIAKSGLNKDGGLGQIGLQFAVRAVVASASFAAVVGAMPGSSENIFFSILFFGANPSLVKDGVMLGTTVIDAIWSLTAVPGPIPLRGAAPPIKKGPSCAKGSTCY